MDAAGAPNPVDTGGRRKRHAIKISVWGGLGLLMLSALVAATIATVFWFYGRDKHLPNLDSLADYHPKQVTLVLDKQGARVGEIFKERRTYVGFDEVPPILVDAFAPSAISPDRSSL